MDWDSLRLAAEIAEAGSLRGAAETAGVSQSTLSRALQRLEKSLGFPIFIRRSHGVEPTPRGLLVLEAAQAISGRLAALDRTLAGTQAAVEGRVRIACTSVVAAEILPSSLRILRRRYPQLGLDIVADSHASNLDRRVADIAIRMFQPRQANLKARKIGVSFTAFYASEDYLYGREKPRGLTDLLAHEVVGPDRDPLFLQQAVELGVSLDGLSYRTDSLLSTLAWVRQGLGIGALLGAVAEREDRLVQLFEPLYTYPVWLVSHPDVIRSVAVRAVWDVLSEELPSAF